MIFLISRDLPPPALSVLLFVSLLESAKICQLSQLSHTKHTSMEKDIEEYYLKVWPAFKGRQRVTIVLKSYFSAELNIQGAFNKLSVVGERRLSDDILILMERISMISRLSDGFSSF